MINFSLEIIPFLVAIALEFTSPLSSKRIQNSIKEKLSHELASKAQINTINEHIEFGSDAIQLNSAIVISMATILILPIFKDRFGVAIIIVIFLLCLLVYGIYYFSRTHPSNHATQKIGLYSWIAILGILLNGMIITLIFT